MLHSKILLAGALLALAACTDVVGPEAPLSPGAPTATLGLSGGATADTLTVGQTLQLTATLKSPGKKARTTTWRSSNTGAVTVTQSGLATGVGVGSAVVTASNGSASQSATIVVTSAAIPTPTPTPPPVSDVVPAPELPRVFVNTTPVAATGTTWSVRAGDNLQQVLDDAAPGDLIALQSGATFTGNFELPAKSGDAWITITAAAGTSLPPVGSRVTPAYAAGLPKLVTTNSASALATRPGAHHYRIVGVEVTAAPGVAAVYSLVSLGTAGTEQSTLAQVPHHLVLDRVYVHGNASLDVRRCVALNSATTGIVDSYLADCHSRTNDSQAIMGWNGPGPFKIVDNYLEGAGENVMFGGSDPSIPNLVPADIEIRRNHFFKPLAWQSAGWIIKNLFELKSAERVLAEGNVLENSWAGQQSGAALVWKSVNQDGSAPWSTTSDVTFRYNVVRRVGVGLSLAGQPEAYPAVRAARFRIAHNVFEQVGEPSLPSDSRAGRLWQVAEALAVDISHNTGTGTTAGLLLVGAPVTGGFAMRDNIFGGGPGIASTDGYGYGTMALNYHVPGWTVAGNVVIGAATSSAAFPPANLYSATSSAAGLSSDLRVVTAPALGSATTDGLAPGADRAMVDRQTAGVVIP